MWWDFRQLCTTRPTTDLSFTYGQRWRKELSLDIVLQTGHWRLSQLGLGEPIIRQWQQLMSCTRPLQLNDPLGIQLTKNNQVFFEIYDCVEGSECLNGEQNRTRTTIQSVNFQLTTPTRLPHASMPLTNSDRNWSSRSRKLDAAHYLHVGDLCPRRCWFNSIKRSTAATDPRVRVAPPSKDGLALQHGLLRGDPFSHDIACGLGLRETDKRCFFSRFSRWGIVLHHCATLWPTTPRHLWR